MTCAPDGRDDTVPGLSTRRADPATPWTRHHVDAVFATIVARCVDGPAPDGTVPAAERLAAEPGGPDADLRQQVGRIASALFCAHQLDSMLVSFTIGRTAEHARVTPATVIDLVAARLLHITSGLLLGALAPVPSTGCRTALPRRDGRGPGSGLPRSGPAVPRDGGHRHDDLPTAEAA